MRVLHVYRTYFPDTQGGLEEVIRQICLNTQTLGVESRVLSLSRNPVPAALHRPEADVYRSRLTLEVASCGVSIGAIRAFRKHLEWADIVHYHFPWPFADVLHYLVKPRQPTLVTYHSDIIRQRLLGRLYAPLMHRFLGSLDQIACTSPNYLTTSEVLQRYRQKVTIIPIGLNESGYPRPTEREMREAAAEFGRDFFLFVGVLRYYKGLHILLDAIKGAPYEVVIAGSGPTEQALKRQARQLGLTNVSFPGHIPDRTKACLLSLSRGVVFPSYLRAEAFGVTLVEGAMYAKPLVSAEVGTGTSFVNVHGETGLVVEPGSPCALRAALDRLCNDSEYAARLGRAARARYEALFTGTEMGARYHEVYQQLSARISCAVSGDRIGP